MIVNKKLVVANSLTFSKRSRLLTRSEFQHVFNHGRKVNGFSMSLFYLANSHQSPRLGIVISKRVMPLAVKRNRYKRLIKESFRLSQETMGKVDIVVLVKKTHGNSVLTTEKLKSELKKLWQRLPHSPKNV